jgi:hypothetical protein
LCFACFFGCFAQIRDLFRLQPHVESFFHVDICF